ncbi:hypothetical protein [Enterococcus casseliflavus]|uniref:hypothetical protein n=1 Tax=Enterococcus casseliflavus TaxID=37734 RepID=UPI001F114A5A|nr:hypothetical protein [Enterococcus casseliflavus]
MKVDKEEFKRIINNASYLEYNYIQLNPENIKDINLKDEEVEYLIVNQVHHKLLKGSRKSLFRDKIIIKNVDENDYKLLKYYVDGLSNDSHYRME